jgi:CheY-like chemotaxis protein
MIQANREILIVDDTAVLRNIMKIQLQGWGFSIFTKPRMAARP